jgi:Protein of unknown function (DUF1428)
MLGRDVSYGKRTSFPRAVKAKDIETVVFSWVIYKSRSHRAHSAFCQSRIIYRHGTQTNREKGGVPGCRGADPCPSLVQFSSDAIAATQLLAD